jgi:type I restriction enzyme, R subunit
MLIDFASDRTWARASQFASCSKHNSPKQPTFWFADAPKMAATFWHSDGTAMSAQQFLELLFGKPPDFFQSEEELRRLWGAPDTRAQLLHGLAEKGFGHDQLAEMQKLISAEKSDLFDVLAHVAYALPPVTREVRADTARVYINSQFPAKQRAFLEFVLGHYVTVGVEKLDRKTCSATAECHD